MKKIIILTILLFTNSLFAGDKLTLTFNGERYTCKYKTAKIDGYGNMVIPLTDDSCIKKQFQSSINPKEKLELNQLRQKIKNINKIATLDKPVTFIGAYQQRNIKRTVNSLKTVNHKLGVIRKITTK